MHVAIGKVQLVARLLVNTETCYSTCKDVVDKHSIWVVGQAEILCLSISWDLDMTRVCRWCAHNCLGSHWWENLCAWEVG